MAQNTVGKGLPTRALATAARSPCAVLGVQRHRRAQAASCVGTRVSTLPGRHGCCGCRKASIRKRDARNVFGDQHGSRRHVREQPGPTWANVPILPGSHRSVGAPVSSFPGKADAKNDGALNQRCCLLQKHLRPESSQNGSRFCNWICDWRTGGSPHVSPDVCLRWQRSSLPAAAQNRSHSCASSHGPRERGGKLRHSHAKRHVRLVRVLVWSWAFVIALRFRTCKALKCLKKREGFGGSAGTFLLSPDPRSIPQTCLNDLFQSWLSDRPQYVNRSGKKQKVELL